MSDLANAKILLIICGGIAAFKSLDLIRRLRERGAEIQPVLTASAARFVTPLSVASLTGAPVRQELFDLLEEAQMGHIELSRAADLVVVAPATANMLAKMAHGFADDLASTALLATDKRVLVAPAMNVRMWLHFATQRNVEQLRADGVTFVGPDEGIMACGEFGPGRMAEPEAIVASVSSMLRHAEPSSQSLAGRKVIVTAGPTHEPIDPVRFIGNRSSGLQGYAIARAAAEAGGHVTLIAGPVALPNPKGVNVVRVQTAREMLAKSEAALPADVFIGAAAVADWRVRDEASQKVKKRGSSPPVLTLVENPDVLATISHSPARPRVIVGFAAETEDVLVNAKKKLERKGCDLIVANAVDAGSSVFGGAENQVYILSAEGVEDWPRLSKEEVGRRIIERVALRLSRSGA